MGACLSICNSNNNNPKEEDSKNTNNTLPVNNITDGQETPLNLSETSLRRTKKKKTRMPKEVFFNEEEEQRFSEKLKKRDSFIDFDESSDDNGKSKEKK